MKKIYILIILMSFMLIPKVVYADDFAPNSKSAILIDAKTKTVLYEKNSKEKRPMASMTKIMSMLLIMEAIENKQISLNDEVVISNNASSMGGSQIFLQTGEKYLVKDLLKGIAISSANDAVVAMGEKIAGSEAAFVELMNKRAKELGLKDTNFQNPHGLDAENHYSTAYDMAIISAQLVKHESILEYTRIYEDYFKKNDGSSIWLVNTNKLVRFYDGIDGLKTGYTSSAGYCLTATIKKNNLRLISVVMGVPTTEQRSSDTVKLVQYGFSSYKLENILTTKDNLGYIDIKKGKLEKGTLVLMEDASILKKITDQNKNYTYKLNKYSVTAPIKTNDIVGNIEIYDESNKLVKSGNLTIKENIKKANFLDYLVRNLKNLTSGYGIFN